MRPADLDLRELLDLPPTGGVLRFADQRVLLMDAGAMGLLRRELVDRLGETAARSVLTRFGFAHGWRTAEAMRDDLPWDSARRGAETAPGASEAPWSDGTAGASHENSMGFQELPGRSISPDRARRDAAAGEATLREPRRPGPHAPPRGDSGDVVASCFELLETIELFMRRPWMGRWRQSKNPGPQSTMPESTPSTL